MREEGSVRGGQMSDRLGTTLGAERTKRQGVKHDPGPRAPLTMFLSGSVFLFQMFVPRSLTQV